MFFIGSNNIVLSQDLDVVDRGDSGGNDCDETRKKAFRSPRQVLRRRVFSSRSSDRLEPTARRDIPANCGIAHRELVLYPFCVSPFLSRRDEGRGMLRMLHLRRVSATSSSVLVCGTKERVLNSRRSLNVATRRRNNK